MPNILKYRSMQYNHLNRNTTDTTNTIDMTDITDTEIGHKP